MKTFNVVLLLFLSIYVSSAAADIVPLAEVAKPGQIVVDDRQVYITENTTVFIYSLPDLKLKKKFGRLGEGPQDHGRRPGDVHQGAPQGPRWLYEQGCSMRPDGA